MGEPGRDFMNDTILADWQIRARLGDAPPLIDDLKDADTQIQPCGVDLTLRQISRFGGPGAIDYDNSARVIAERQVIEWVDGWVYLPAGSYHVIYNERVNLPPDIMALAYPRSSLLRCGATVYTAVWDPGYSGRAEALLAVQNRDGLHLAQNARIVQLVFTRLSNPVDSQYAGRYHGENT
jgi:dUTP pyrophosphatase